MIYIIPLANISQRYNKVFFFISNSNYLNIYIILMIKNNLIKLGVNKSEQYS